MSDTREWSEAMGEISGFGGSYEDGCRTMVLAGLDWLDAHPAADPAFRGFKGIYGVLREDNADAKALSAAMCDAANAKHPKGGVTGAMHQATVSHVLWIRKNGWDRYVRERIDATQKEKGSVRA